jgi:hypothetical protein
LELNLFNKNGILGFGTSVALYEKINSEGRSISAGLGYSRTPTGENGTKGGVKNTSVPGLRWSPASQVGREWKPKGYFTLQNKRKESAYVGRKNC